MHRPGSKLGKSLTARGTDNHSFSCRAGETGYLAGGSAPACSDSTQRPVLLISTAPSPHTFAVTGLQLPVFVGREAVAIQAELLDPGQVGRLQQPNDAVAAEAA